MKDPDCPCFNDPRTKVHVMSNMVALSQAFGAMLVQGSHEAQICHKAMPEVFEMAIINMATIIALDGTIIEMGSQEAQWETERILTGLEGRLLERVREYYRMVREQGLTVKDGKVVLRENT